MELENGEEVNKIGQYKQNGMMGKSMEEQFGITQMEIENNLKLRMERYLVDT